jgi:menaquinone-dependent protoporphyrinogen oxidase
MKNTNLSRREALKIGCLATAAGGLAICGTTAALTGAEPAPVELASASYGAGARSPRVLVAYASATGSTVEVAAAIGETLGTHGLQVDVRPVREDLLVDAYQAVVIGSAVQYGDWLSEALEFLRRNQEKLAQLPVATFCVHITNLGEDPTSRRNRQAFLDGARRLVNAREEAFFAGRFDRRGAALMLPGWLARFIPTMDRRDWTKIRAWADNLTTSLLPNAG